MRSDVLQQYNAFYGQGLLNQDRMDDVIHAYINHEIHNQSIRGTYAIGATVPGLRDVVFTAETPEDLSRLFIMHVVAEMSLSVLQQYEMALNLYGNVRPEGKFVREK